MKSSSPKKAEGNSMLLMSTDTDVSNASSKSSKKIMPDVANERRATVRGTLNRVGMQSVELPLLVSVKEGVQMMVPGKANLYVNLADPDSKGIHMSRLYSIAQDHFQAECLSFELLEKILGLYMKSHEDISTEAVVEVEFELMIQRPSLKSGKHGWRSYPVRMSAESHNGTVTRLAEVDVTYSSTCPCSASLARQLIQDRFSQNFEGQDQLSKTEMLEWLGKEDSICATPHSQRSVAYVKVSAPSGGFAPLQLINEVEEAISTPVQAMVKREDEQEFALLNGQNLMFCEDAARRLKAFLIKKEYADFRCEVQHQESLHPHDAVAIVVKGIPDGFKA